MNRTLDRVENVDTGTFGAALLAATGVGIYSSLQEAVTKGVVINRSFHPQSTTRDRNDALYRSYRESYQQLKPVFDSLYKIMS